MIIDHFSVISIAILCLLIAAPVLYLRFIAPRRRRDLVDGDERDKTGGSGNQTTYWGRIEGIITLLSNPARYVLGLCGLAHSGVSVSLSRRPCCCLHVAVAAPRLQSAVLDRINRLIQPYCPLVIVGAAAEAISVTLSPSDIWTGNLPEITATSLVLAARLERPCDWSIDRGLAYACDVKHGMANYLTDIVNRSRSLVPRASWTARALDHILDLLRVKVAWFEIRIFDEVADFTFGLTANGFDMAPGSPSEESMMNIPHIIRATSCQAYLSPKAHAYAADATQSSQGQCGEDIDVLMSCDLLQWDLEFPATWSTSMQPGVRPMGRGKRIRLKSFFHHVVVNVHPEQLPLFIYGTLKSTGAYEYYTFLKHFINIDSSIRRTYATEVEEQEYQAQYMNMLQADTAAEKQAYLAAIRNLEIPFTLSGIMRLRRRIFKWTFPKADLIKNDEISSKVNEPSVLSYPEAHDEGEGNEEEGMSRDEAEADAAMAAFLRLVKPWWDDVFRPIREISVDIDVNGLIIAIFDDECSESSPALHSYNGGELAVLAGPRASASLTVLVGPDDSGIMCGARPDSTREPEVKWIDISGDIMSPSIELCNISRDRLLFSHSSPGIEPCLKWSVRFDGQRRSYYSFNLLHSVVDSSYISEWKRVCSIVRKATCRPVEPSVIDLYPVQNARDVISLGSSRKHSDITVLNNSSILEKHETSCRRRSNNLFGAWNGEFIVALSHVDVVVRCSGPVSDCLTIGVSAIVTASNWPHQVENISADISRLVVSLHNSAHSSGNNPNNISIVDMEGLFFQSVDSIRYFTEGDLHRARVACSMRDGFNGYHVTRCAMKVNFLDTFRELSSALFDRSTQRASVMLNARLRMTAEESVNDSNASDDSDSAQSSQVSLVVSGDGAGTLEFFLAHLSILEDINLELDMFLLVETILGGSKSLIGTASMCIPVKNFLLTERSVAEGKVPTTSQRLVVPITQAIGLSAPLRPLKASVACTHALLSIAINSVRLVSISEDLSADGDTPFAYIRISSKNPVVQHNNHANSEAAVSLKKHFLFKPLLPGEENYRLVTKKTQSRQIIDVQQDVEYNETLLLPCAMATESISLKFEVVVERRFSEHVLAAAEIQGSSLIEVIEKSMSLTLRDRDGFSAAIVSGRINWSQDCLASSSAAIAASDGNGDRFDLSLEGGLQALRNVVPGPASSSIWDTTNNALDLVSTDASNSASCRDREISFHMRAIHLNISKSTIIRIASFVDTFAPTPTNKPAPSKSDLAGSKDSVEREYSSLDLVFPHKGELVALFGELDAPDVRDIVLGDFASVVDMIVYSSAAYYPIDFWQHFCAATACTDRMIHLSGYQCGQDRWIETGLVSDIIKIIQTKMILGFRNYQLAEAAWRYIVVPAWTGVPRVGGFSVTKGVQVKYRPMSCPVIAGDGSCRVYVDSNVILRSLPHELETVPLGGIMTASSDRILSGSKLFELEVADACTLFLCFDVRVKSHPAWIANYGFITSNMTLSTTSATYTIFVKHIQLNEDELTREISLGGCGLYRLSDGDNYFLLYSSLMPQIGTAGAESKGEISQSSFLHRPPLADCASVDCRWSIRADAPVPNDRSSDEPEDGRANVDVVRGTPDESVAHSVSRSSTNLVHREPDHKHSSICRSYVFANINSIRVSFSHESVGGRASSLDLCINALELDSRMRHGESIFDLAFLDEVRTVATVEFSVLMNRFRPDTLALGREILLPFRLRCMLSKDPFALTLSNTLTSLNAAVIECPPELLPLCMDISSSLTGMYESLAQRAEGLALEAPREVVEAETSLRWDPEYPFLYSTAYESWCLTNHLGVDIQVRLESPLDLCVVVDSVCLQINKSFDRTVVVKAEQIAVFYLARRTDFELSTLNDTKIVVYIDGWQVDTPISIQSFGRKLYRIAIDDMVSAESRDIKVPGSYVLSEDSGSDVIDNADDNEEFWSCDEESAAAGSDSNQGSISDEASADEEKSSVGSLTWKSVSGEESIAEEDGNTAVENADAINVTQVEKSFEKSKPLNRAIRKRSKISPFAVEAVVEPKPSTSKGKSQLQILLRSNISVSNDAKEILNISYSDDKNKSDVVALVKGQQSPVPLNCLRNLKLFYAYPESLAGVSDSSFSHHRHSEKRAGGLQSVALATASFNASVPRALRTSKDLEKNSIKVRMSNLSEEAFQTITEKKAKANFLASWDLIFYPACKIVNALPCNVRFQVAQPPSSDRPLEKRDSKSLSKVQKRQASSLATSELFFLPSEFYTKSTGGCFDVDVQVEFENASDLFPNDNIEHFGQPSCETLLLDATVQPGKIVEFSNFDIAKNLYFRLSIPGTDLWTKPIGITPTLLQHRSLFSRHSAEDLFWDFNRYQDILLITPPEIRFKREWATSRTLVIFSQFWIVNKTGVSLLYDPVPNTEKLKRDKSSAAAQVAETLNSEDEQEKRHSKIPKSKNRLREEKLTDFHPEKRQYLSDSGHLQFFGNSSIPLLLSSKKRRIRLLTLSVGDAARKYHQDELYVYDLQTSSPSSFRYVESYGLSGINQVYSDVRDINFTSWPESIRDSKGLVHIKTADSDKLSDVNDESVITFRTSINADVYVCIDARLSKAPRWMSILGFRATGERLKTTSPNYGFVVYKKFYKGHSLVSLGGNKASTGFKSPANMYVVFVVKPQSTSQFFQPTIDGKVHFSPRAISKISSALGAKSVACKMICKVQIGESVFSDEDAPLHSWPKMFNAISMLCIQTADGDKHLKSKSYLKFSLQQPSRVLICIDSSIKYNELPSWIGENGFSPISLTVSAGRSVFYVYQQLFGAEVCCLGGLDYRGNSKVSNYFVLIADEFEFQNAWNLMSMSSAVVSPGQPQAMVGVKATERDSVPGIIDSVPKSPLSSKVTGNLRNNSRPITSFWDNETVSAGKCSLDAIPVNLVERCWSEKCIDLKSGNKGEIVVGNCIYSVRVDYMPGVFYRTSLLTLMPRFLIVNQSTVDLGVFPFCIDPSSSPRALGDYSGWSGFEERCRVINKGESVALIAFHDANGPGGNFIRINRVNSESKSPQRKRWLYFFSRFDSSLSEFAPPENGYDYQTICPDSVGEQYTFIQHTVRRGSQTNDRGTLVVLSVTVVVVDQCVVLTVRDISHSPPVRLENHLTGVAIKFRQVGIEHEWVQLGPRSWTSFVWSNKSLAKSFEFFIENHHDRIFTCSAEKIEGISDIVLPGDVVKSYQGSQSSGPESRILRIHITTDDVTRVLRIIDGGAVSSPGRRSRRFGDLSRFMHPSIAAAARTKTKSPKSYASFASRSLKIAKQYLSRNSRWIQLSNFFFVKIQVKLMALLIKFVESSESSRMNLEFSDRISSQGGNDLVDISVEGICLTLDGSKYIAQLSIMHMQLDDMHSTARFPVAISPSNSGFNSHLAIEKLATAIPVLQFLIEIEPNTMHLVHVKTLDAVIQPLRVSLDGALLVRALKFWGHAVRLLMLSQARNLSGSTAEPSSSSSLYFQDAEQFVLDASVRAVMDRLYFTLNDVVQKCLSAANDEFVYIEVLHVSSIVLNLELFMDHGRYVRSREGEGGGGTSAVASDDVSAAMGLAGLDARIASVLSVVGAAVRSIGHVSPLLSFNEILITNFFGHRQLLRRFFVASYKREALLQSYKILGSMEILGDPLSLAHNLGAGVVQLFRQTRAEVIGDSSTRGEGLKRLARAVVSGTAGSASKIAGSLAELLSALAGVDVTAAGLEAEGQGLGEAGEEEKRRVSLVSTPEGIDDFAPLETSGYRDRHIITNSVKRGGTVVVNSLVEGISSLALEPVRGLESGGVLGAARGVAKGIFKAVATPVAGALGAVSVLTQSVERKARFGGKVPVGRRRPHLLIETSSISTGAASGSKGTVSIASRVGYDWMEPQYSDTRNLHFYEGLQEVEEEEEETTEYSQREEMDDIDAARIGGVASANGSITQQSTASSYLDDPSRATATAATTYSSSSSGSSSDNKRGGASKSPYFSGADFIGIAL